MDKSGHSLLATRQPKQHQLPRRLAATLLLAGLALLLPGCSVLQAPQKVVTAVIPAGQSKDLDPLYLQVQLERFSDDFSAQTAAAIDEYVRRVGTPSARLDGLRWKVGALSAAIGIASGPFPKANLLDMVALATLTRTTLQERRADFADPQAAQPWLDTASSLETNIWTLATTVLPPPQISELRDAIRSWHSQNPEVLTAFFARPQEFAAMVKPTPQKGSQLNSVFNLVSLDPTAGLDPAVREVTLTRLFAERAMYTAQRMPYLLRLQAELLTEQVARQPGVQDLLTNTARMSESMDRISRAADSVSQTAAQLPERIAAEREAILRALDQQEGKLRGLAAEVDRSLVDAGRMSDSLSITITNFNALMKRFGVGEVSTNSAPDTNSPPFNILDYAKTAAQISDMARELNTLITSANQSVPKVAQLGQQATADVGRLVDRAFWLGLVLILVLLLGGVIAAVAYRAFSVKLDHGKPQSSSPD